MPGAHENHDIALRHELIHPKSGHFCKSAKILYMQIPLISDKEEKMDEINVYLCERRSVKTMKSESVRRIFP